MAEKRREHIERQKKPKAEWTAADHSAEIALAQRRAARDPQTRTTWHRVTANAPQHIHDLKALRIREQVTYYFRYGCSMSRLLAAHRAVHPPQRAGDRPQLTAHQMELRTLGIRSSAPTVGQNSYGKEVRGIIRGSTGLLCTWGDLRHMGPLLDCLYLRDSGEVLLRTILLLVDKSGHPRPRRVAVYADGWHPSVWSRTGDGALVKRSRMAVQFSVWVGPILQEFWRWGLLAVVLGAAESQMLLALVFLRLKIFSVITRLGLLFYFIVDGGLRKKIWTKAFCRFCKKAKAEIQLLSATRNAKINFAYMETEALQLPIPRRLKPWEVVTEWLHLLALWMVAFIRALLPCPRVQAFVNVAIKTSITPDKKRKGPAAAAAGAAVAAPAGPAPAGPPRPALRAPVPNAAEDKRGKSDMTSLAIHDLTRLTRHYRGLWLAVSPPLPAAVRAFELLCLLRNDLSCPPDVVHSRVVELHAKFKELKIELTLGMHEAAHVKELMELLEIRLAGMAAQGGEKMNQRVNVDLASAHGHLGIAMAHVNARIGAVASGYLPHQQSSAADDDAGDPVALAVPDVAEAESQEAVRAFLNDEGQPNPFAPRYLSTYDLEGRCLTVDVSAVETAAIRKVCRCAKHRAALPDCFQCPDGACGGSGGGPWCSHGCS